MQIVKIFSILSHRKYSLARVIFCSSAKLLISPAKRLTTTQKKKGIRTNIFYDSLLVFIFTLQRKLDARERFVWHGQPLWMLESIWIGVIYFHCETKQACILYISSQIKAVLKDRRRQKNSVGARAQQAKNTTCTRKNTIQYTRHRAKCLQMISRSL